MADALCGPSNPLQSLRKHTQVDRTLQQDRLVQARHQPLGGEQFRTHDPRAGTLDAALDAFEHAQPQLHHALDLHHHQLHQPQQQQQHPTLTTRGGGGWAADFQRLHISQPQPMPVQSPLITRTHTHTGWHTDFFLQQQQPQHQQNGELSLKGKEAGVGTDAFAYQSPLNGLAMQRGLMGMDMGIGLDQQQQQHTPSSLTQEHNQQQWESFSSEAFEAAFQDALVSETQAQQQQQPEILNVLGPDTIKIGSDAIPYTEVKDRSNEQSVRDADDLARTAGQLVEMMKDESETNRKFRESEFLQLMRRIRDREVEVRDNEMVETATGTPTVPSQGNVVLQDQQQPHTAEATEPLQKAEQDANKDDQWTFPDMDEIYAPTNNDLDTASRSYSPFVEEPLRQQQLPPNLHGPFDEQSLHPGGRWYPEQQQQQPSSSSSSAETVMSGAVTTH